MRTEELKAYCLDKKGAWPDNPWNHEHPVIKVSGKIFAFLDADKVGVKAGASREEADEWLARYPEHVHVMAYIGRSGWNDLSLRGGIPDEELLEAVDTSYDLVVARLPKSRRP